MTQSNISPNAAWMARSRAHVWHPCTQMQHHERLPLVPIARGEGAWLIDFEGKRYLDAVSSWWTNLFGHNHPRLKAAIARQLNELDHVMLAGFTHAPAVELAEALCAVAPDGLQHVMYASDGASATEIALKMAVHAHALRGAPKKSQLVSVRGAYHGETVGALSVTDVPIFRSAYAAMLKAQHFVENPATASSPQAAVKSLETLLLAEGDNIAAFIVEPLVQGANGMKMHAPSYIQQCYALCKAHNVTFIADEIMTGFGRTGTLFACEQAGITPDILCLSKGITGGTLPLSAVLTTDAIYDAFYHEDVTRGFLHSHSYTGNPLACAAAREVLRIFQDEDVIERNKTRSAQLQKVANDIMSTSEPIETMRTTGMIVAFDIRTERKDFARAAFAHAMERGVLLRPIGKTVYWMPPYCLSDSECAQLAEVTAQTIRAVA
jgi:adenosylmethionine---8-amino-7-oxononanoate aminotransferase